MAVKIHCSICDKFIKRVYEKEIQKITGREMCEDCGAEVTRIKKELDDMVTEVKKDLDKRHKSIMKRYHLLFFQC